MASFLSHPLRLNFRTIGMSLGISIFSFFLLLSLLLYAVNLRHKIKEDEQRFFSLQRLTLRSQETAILIKTHPEDFEAFELCAFKDPLTPKILQSSLPHPIEFGPISSLEADGLVSQEVSFTISCLQDREVFSLVDQLSNQGPGIFHIHEITIARLSPLSEEMVKKVAAGKTLTLFEGRITATWIHR